MKSCMKLVWILNLVWLLIAGNCWADVVGEITDVKHDPLRGSIIVETVYKIDGRIVQTGHIRYDETSGTVSEISALVNQDIQEHCQALIRRIDSNEEFLTETRLNKNNELTQPILDELKPLILGHKETVITVTEEYKGVQIDFATDKPPAIK